MKSIFSRIMMLYLLCLGLGYQNKISAQTTLVSGDILFTGYNGIASSGSASDTFTFVILTPISANTTIYFTERGYQGAGIWQASGGTEGTIQWTSATPLSIGQEVEISGIGANAAKVNGVPNGTVSIVSGGNATTGLSLSNAGDQIIAFQGGAGDPTNGAAVMISGISWALSCGTTTVEGWNGAGCSFGPQSSTLPPGLTGNVNAFLVGTPGTTPNNDHGKFNCNGAPYASVSSLKTAIMTLSNWSLGGSTGTTIYSLPPGCNYYASCSNPTIITPPTNTTVCNGNNTSFTITATGATAYQWQLNSGSGFTNISDTGVYSNTSTATLNITGVLSAMNGYLYRCIVSNGTCSSTTSSATLVVSSITLSPASQTNVTCNGDSNGAASVNNASGGTAPYTYNWTPNNPTGDGTTAVSGLTAGTWTCTVTDDNSCTATHSFTITQPTAINTTVTQADGILTAIETGATYQWYSCPDTVLINNETNQTLIPTVLGNYQVEITVGNCSAVSDCIAVTALGNNSFEPVTNFNIYPNPTNEWLKIDTGIDRTFVIVNQLGQTLKKFEANANTENIINIADLADGIYYIKQLTIEKSNIKTLILKK
ncbi:T9SS type A sorting domain-containing protein [Flavobacterium mekongense]|uniref:T9SS type A sorting domain-containing protein n=1 Tax=Flavobacterium mekongense TaxID=3379707 RepID=UPI00399C0EE8